MPEYRKMTERRNSDFWEKLSGLCQVSHKHWWEFASPPHTPQGSFQALTILPEEQRNQADRLQPYRRSRHITSYCHMTASETAMRSQWSHQFYRALPSAQGCRTSPRRAPAKHQNSRTSHMSYTPSNNSWRHNTHGTTLKRPQLHQGTGQWCAKRMCQHK